jgi:hypothetical protein
MAAVHASLISSNPFPGNAGVMARPTQRGLGAPPVTRMDRHMCYL